MTCMCGDTECPSCGLAQGTLDERDVLRETDAPWLAQRMWRVGQPKNVLSEVCTIYCTGEPAFLYVSDDALADLLPDEAGEFYARRRANAYLIAAAPDLYAAAIAARDENRHGDGSSKSLAALDKILCDAIAKAEGGVPEAAREED